jgi:hypothetical protein
MAPYAELRPNETICDTFTKAMQQLGSQFICDLGSKAQAGYGTDMGKLHSSSVEFRQKDAN